ncbi:DUF4177 domain-containing protein [Maribacter stanieri]|jgi:hypothetical protein|uniref:DUF4177 domain-containing protein n=1 Tax=Maribacter stanieri TaxID=440514 RepID=UPI0024952131|nr:DUF4177 domain-containing protein [Maribacter stanieri]|tara:strand:+ start:9973 stop:10164 length:192 start_codon:yes stop_codon:yes gene_type:complete
MFEYKYVKIGLSGLFTTNPNTDYKTIIANHAKEGWRFVQIFAPAISGYGKAAYFELIFEKKTE